MVCSACGFESQTGMRFCGMCGTPLPHRPLTADGAQSTLSLTRMPLESSRAASHEQNATLPGASSRTGIWLESPGGDGTPRQAADEAPASPSNVAGALVEEPAAVASHEPPPRELVPDVPLDEYLQNFRYEPPSEPAEITMRGDLQVLESDAHAPGAEGATAVVEHGAASSAVDETQPRDEATETVDASTVVSRLGLEPETPEEARIQRPRFLDINEPVGEKDAALSGTSVVVGPSFLGASDTPPAKSEPPHIEEEASAQNRWTVWLGVAAVLVVAALAVMEWRAQANHSDDGPVELVKAKFRDWQSNPSQGSSEPAPAASSDANAKPDVKVQEPPKPQPQGPAGNGSSAPTSSSGASTTPSTQVPNTPPGAKPVAAAQPSAEQPASASKTTQPPAASNEKPTALKQPAEPGPKPASPKGTAEAKAESPKPTASSGEGNEPAMPAKPNAAGAEEMTKARNASDSAAQAAWLWKATAKGNPDAPVDLANMYIKGTAVPRSCEQALVLLKTAAEKENARARNRLAALYSGGMCVQRSRVEAYRWLSSALAANPSSQWAQQNRDLLWEQMTPDERAAAAKYR